MTSNNPIAFVVGAEKDILWLRHDDGTWTGIQLLKGDVELRSWNEDRNDGGLIALLPLGIVTVYDEQPL